MSIKITVEAGGTRIVEQYPAPFLLSHPDSARHAGEWLQALVARAQHGEQSSPSQILDLLSAWLTFPDEEGQWRSACDFIEFAAGLVARTGRSTDPVVTCDECNSSGEPPSWHATYCSLHPDNEVTP